MTDSWSEWPAPAKLNLFLHIVGRRADGYHLLQSVFQLLDWGDRISLRPRKDDAIVRVAGSSDVAPERDLAVRAAIELRRATGTTYGADIRVSKEIPTGGGLGGGSSDAATVLVALNQIWRTGLNVDALAQIGLGLGADVPVFVRGHSAWAEGVGEQLTPVDLPARHYIIVDPRVHVPTAELFQSPELTRNSTPLTISDYLGGVATANVFAPVVSARYAPVAAAMEWLGRYGEARLSGSGGCVFAAVETDKVDVALHDCPPQFAAFSAEGVNRSPLLDAVERYRSGS